MRTAERLGEQIATLAVVMLAVLITANVILREAVGQAIPDSVIMVRELMLAAVVLPLAMATAQRAHIAVTFLADLASPAWQGRLVVLGSVAGLVALAPLIWAGAREAAHAWRSAAFYDGMLDLPRWPGRAVFTLGLVAMWLRLAMLAAGDLAQLRREGRVDALPQHDEGV